MPPYTLTHHKKNQKKIRKYKQNTQDLWGIIKRPELQIISIEEEIGTRNILNKTIAENFPNLGKEMVIQAQKNFKTQCKPDQKRISPNHNIKHTEQEKNSGSCKIEAPNHI
jgi:hypothetical protein